MLLETLLARLIGDSAVGSLKSAWRRLRGQPHSSAGVDEAARERRAIARDFGTGLGQATMAVRDALEAFDRLGVLVDPDDGTLYEPLGDRTREAYRVVAELEARLPKLQMAFKPSSAIAMAAASAIRDLRESLDHLQKFYSQSDEDEWSQAEREAAGKALDSARDHQAKFIDRASHA